MSTGDLVPKTQEIADPEGFFGPPQVYEKSADDIRFDAWYSIGILDRREREGRLDETDRWLRDTLVKQHGRDPRHEVTDDEWLAMQKQPREDTLSESEQK